MFKQLKIQAEDLFKQATFEEFYGKYLFETSEQVHYFFTPDEENDSVCLVEQPNQQFEALRMKEAKKLPIINQSLGYVTSASARLLLVPGSKINESERLRPNCGKVVSRLDRKLTRHLSTC